MKNFKKYYYKNILFSASFRRRILRMYIFFLLVSLVILKTLMKFLIYVFSFRESFMVSHRRKGGEGRGRAEFMVGRI